MLTSLSIRNYALIETLQLEPSAGLNIITGETGAGKSIMLGALGLVLGNRADTRVLLHTEEKCTVEAVFKIGDESLLQIFKEADIDFESDCILRREIAPSGKSRAFINDTPVSLDTLRAIAVRLMDIHSQHDTQELGSQHYQLSVLDAFAGLGPERDAMQKAHEAFTAARKALQAATDNKALAGRERDFAAFQLQEIAKAKVQADELESLDQELTLLAHTEDIKTRLAQADSLLQSAEGDAITRIKTALQALEKAASYAPALSKEAERLGSLLVELKDIAQEVEAFAERIDYDPARITWVQNRLGILTTLAKKHGVQTTAELLALQGVFSEQLADFDSLEHALEGLALAHNKYKTEAETAADFLHAKRVSQAPNLEAELGVLLAEVGMPNARFEIELKQGEVTATGKDVVRFLFSANKGMPLQELKTAASGGEFSRLMLCLKYVLAGKTQLPTLLFDEIDTGISGEIALRVSRLMGRMAAKHQLLVITHMPQIAAKGTRHYYVYKEDGGKRTSTHIKALTDTERVAEIAQMIGGANPSQTALQNARELMVQT